MHTTHKIQLRPNNKQKTYFAKACGISRMAYNWGLARWNEKYEANKLLKKENRVSISGISLNNDFNSIKKAEFSFTSEVTKYACQRPFQNLERAFKSFLKNKKGFPKFKKKGRSRDSFYIGGDHIELTGKKVWIPKLGFVKMTEFLRFEGKINSATISRTADKWFASIQIDAIEPSIIPTTKKIKPVGLDMGINSVVVTSDGHDFKALPPLRKTLRKLKRAQRQMAKKYRAAKSEKRELKTAKNYQKQKMKVAKIHARVANQRKDILHKITSAITNNYTDIAIEDLNVKGMVKNHNLSRAILDVGFGEFRRQLEYKAKNKGRKIHLVDRFYPSSKTCSSCGIKKEKLLLAERIFKCECGLKISRDLNAAINLKNKIGGASTEFTPVEITALQKSVHPVLVSSIIESGIKHQTGVS